MHVQAAAVCPLDEAPIDDRHRTAPHRDLCRVSGGTMGERQSERGDADGAE